MNVSACSDVYLLQHLLYTWKQNTDCSNRKQNETIELGLNADFVLQFRFLSIVDLILAHGILFLNDICDKIQLKMHHHISVFKF